MPTAAAVIIGNEILTGKFDDLNGPWLVRRCRELGLDMIQVSIIEDTTEAIGAEVKRLSAMADWVFTTGGIGPTHDDVTMKGIATAFDIELERNPEISSLITERLGDRVNADVLRMADIPAGSVLWQEERSRFPVVVCQNVLIFPGVPEYLRAKFDDIAHRLGGTPVSSEQLRTNLTEGDVAASLRAADSRWPDVAIGSYPRFDTKPHSVVITLDSRNQEALMACTDWLRRTFKTLE